MKKILKIALCMVFILILICVSMQIYLIKVNGYIPLKTDSKIIGETYFDIDGRSCVVFKGSASYGESIKIGKLSVKMNRDGMRYFYFNNILEKKTSWKGEGDLYHPIHYRTARFVFSSEENKWKVWIWQRECNMRLWDEDWYPIIEDGTLFHNTWVKRNGEYIFCFDMKWNCEKWKYDVEWSAWTKEGGNRKEKIWGYTSEYYGEIPYYSFGESLVMRVKENVFEVASREYQGLPPYQWFLEEIQSGNNSIVVSTIRRNTKEETIIKLRPFDTLLTNRIKQILLMVIMLYGVAVLCCVKVLMDNKIDNIKQKIEIIRKNKILFFFTLLTIVFSLFSIICIMVYSAIPLGVVTGIISIYLIMNTLALFNR